MHEEIVQRFDVLRKEAHDFSLSIALACVESCGLPAAMPRAGNAGTRATSVARAGSGRSGPPGKEIPRAARKLKLKRAKATFKRNICDAKVTPTEITTKSTETPRISRIPATKTGF
ncbi:hypothetical protein [Mesorhizobium sp. SARCC-RB16n]|uniref:hypothetical protein n=1 Tax=Mesorhizobium sp. SARCC-RB16n TaxID=2116687 RepID=UPI00166E7338|nr:hypothetical protein [Mesorhizobium sp. SARCC-RB16n]